MYTFDFLEAKVPLTKTFSMQDGVLETFPYPMIKRVTSHRESAENLEELYELLVKHADQNHCLLKGLLKQPVTNESRAGLTQPEAMTSWLLLDLDFAEGWDSVEDIVDELGFKDVSFIFQHSSSAGIKGDAGLRGHVYLLLESGMSPSAAKVWLREANLRVNGLADRVNLAANGQSLRWPLDVSTCQNDKLIYIAPPLCRGLSDPMEGKRFELRTRGKAKAVPPKVKASVANLRERQDRKVEDLRSAAGLKKQKPKTKVMEGHDVLLNPDEAIVTGSRIARGFVYLNLNGGDSWAYYFPETRPDYVYNFKGEPVVLLKDLAPDFYSTYKADLEARLEKHEVEGEYPFVFRDPERDLYYNAIYDSSSDTLTLHGTSSFQRLQHFLLQYDMPPPDVIEDWTVEFDPTSKRVVDFKSKWVNSYDPSEYLRADYEPANALPLVIGKVLDSICVGDKEIQRHFINWLAFIYQTREKAGTAWVFHGVSGTGKGILVSKLLAPLFGRQQVLEYTTQNIEDGFNDPMERANILWLDEFHSESARQGSSVMNKLKNYITEPTISIRAMRQSTVLRPNYMNIIIATNHPDPIRIPDHDRRFNIAPAQETPLEITRAEIEMMDRELPLFAAYLQHYDVDVDEVKTIIHNEARDNMIVAGQTTLERLFTAVRNCDLDYFISYLEQKSPAGDAVAYQLFEKAVHRWCLASFAGKHIPVTRDELRQVYGYVIGHAMAPSKFTRICSIHRLPFQTLVSNGRPTSALHILWKSKEPEILTQIVNTITEDNVHKLEVGATK